MVGQLAALVWVLSRFSLLYYKMQQRQDRCCHRENFETRERLKISSPAIEIFETQVQLQIIIRSKEIMRPKVRLTFEFTSLAYSELSLGIYSENLNNEQLFSLILV